MSNASKILLAIGVGAAVGAVLGVLYAPDEGYETRRKIVKRSKKLAGTITDGLDESKESLEEIKEILQKQINKVNRRLEEIRL